MSDQYLLEENYEGWKIMYKQGKFVATKGQEVGDIRILKVDGEDDVIELSEEKLNTLKDKIAEWNKKEGKKKFVRFEAYSVGYRHTGLCTVTSKASDTEYWISYIDSYGNNSRAKISILDVFKYDSKNKKLIDEIIALENEIASKEKETSQLREELVKKNRKEE